MTAEELKQYNALSERMKVEYSKIKSEHPDWSHVQIMIKVSLDQPLSGCICKDSNEENSIWGKLKKIFK